MIKKLTLLAMAVGALVAFAVPAAASAHVLTQNEEAVEGTISATSGNTITVLATGTLECTTVKINGNVEQNNGTVLLGMDGENDKAEGCVLNKEGVKIPVTVTPTFEQLHLETGGTNTAKFSFVVHLPDGSTCSESSGASLVTPTTGKDLIHIEATVNGTCGLGGKLTGTFTLTQGGQPVIVS